MASSHTLVENPQWTDGRPPIPLVHRVPVAGRAHLVPCSLSPTGRAYPGSSGRGDEPVPAKGASSEKTPGGSDGKLETGPVPR
jgi:hypothetical protein